MPVMGGLPSPMDAVGHSYARIARRNVSERESAALKPRLTCELSGGPWRTQIRTGPPWSGVPTSTVDDGSEGTDLSPKEALLGIVAFRSFLCYSSDCAKDHHPAGTPQRQRQGDRGRRRWRELRRHPQRRTRSGITADPADPPDLCAYGRACGSLAAPDQGSTENGSERISIGSWTKAYRCHRACSIPRLSSTGTTRR